MFGTAGTKVELKVLSLVGVLGQRSPRYQEAGLGLS